MFQKQFIKNCTAEWGQSVERCPFSREMTNEGCLSMYAMYETTSALVSCDTHNGHASLSQLAACEKFKFD